MNEAYKRKYAAEELEGALLCDAAAPPALRDSELGGAGLKIGGKVKVKRLTIPTDFTIGTVMTLESPLLLPGLLVRITPYYSTKKERIVNSSSSRRGSHAHTG